MAPQEGWADALMIAAWPEAQEIEGWEDEKINNFNLVQDLVRGIRNVRTEKKLNPGKRIPALIIAGENMPTLEDQLSSIASLAGLEPDALTLVESLEEKPTELTALVASGVEIYLSLADVVDQEAEKARFGKRINRSAKSYPTPNRLIKIALRPKSPACIGRKGT